MHIKLFHRREWSKLVVTFYTRKSKDPRVVYRIYYWCVHDVRRSGWFVGAVLPVCVILEVKTFLR